MAKVQLTAEAKEDLRDLDGSAQKLVFRALKKLEVHPEQRGQPLGSHSGQGNLTGYRKLVVGDRDFRIIFQVDHDGTVVVIWVIAERADDRCYELAVARLKTYQQDPELRRELERLLATAWEATSF